MARTRQQVLGALVMANDQMHNGWHLAIVEVEEQAQWLTNVEHNVDIMKIVIERVEAMMMHMAQSLWAQL